MKNQLTWVWMVVGFAGMLAVLMFYNTNGAGTDVKASAGENANDAPVEQPARPQGGGGCGV